MRLIILGGPGSGKGTQSQQLAQHLSIPWIATGEILRQAITHQTDLGQKAKPYMDQGELVPDILMIEFIRHRILQSDITEGWVLDGYPRTAFQAEELDFLLDHLNQKLTWAIYLTVPNDIMFARLITRAKQRPIPRLDESPEAIQNRINSFTDYTIPILEYYEPRHKLITINGDQPPELVEQEILSKINHQPKS